VVDILEDMDGIQGIGGLVVDGMAGVGTDLDGDRPDQDGEDRMDLDGGDPTDQDGEDLDLDLDSEGLDLEGPDLDPEGLDLEGPDLDPERLDLDLEEGRKKGES